MADQVKKHPSRFIGLGTVPLQAPELAVAELQRCVKELGFAGVIIGTHVNEWSLDAPDLSVFWEAAEDLGAVVFIHPHTQELRGSDTQMLLPRLVGESAEICHSVTTLLSGRVLDNFPKLKVCFAHGAGTFPYVQEQLVHGLLQNGGGSSSAAEAAQ